LEGVDGKTKANQQNQQQIFADGYGQHARREDNGIGNLGGWVHIPKSIRGDNLSLNPGSVL
jgi:hypothetical protein